MANQLLDGYEPVKAVGGSGKKTPIVKITAQEGVFLKGVLLSKKTFKDQEGKERLIANFKLIETTAPMILKGAAGYAPVTDVAAGSEVSIYGAPTRLERLLNAVEDGGKYEVYIVYEGKKRDKLANGKSVSAHNFKLGKRPVVVNTSADESGVPD